MNIVHITSFGNNMASGMTNIVPQHIKSQSKYSKVFWYNLIETYVPEEELKSIYFSTNNHKFLYISELPEPYCHPDLVVFHGVYFPKYCKIAKELKRRHIPYIVVPHGSLTKFTTKQKPFKKFLGFLLMFKRFIKDARAIQYLTKGEYELSGDSWNKNYMIIPNGCEIPLSKKTKFNIKNPMGIFIGRKSIYNKGLDLLIEACYLEKELLERNKIKIHIYGPDRQDSHQVLERLIQKYCLENVIIVHDSVFGEEKMEVLKNCDFFILTSRSEGHPVSIIEALSFGIPCLVTRETNMGNEIENAKAGWVADLSSEGVKKALGEVVREKNEIPIIGNNARNLSMNYEWSKIARNAIKQYRQIINLR